MLPDDIRNSLISDEQEEPVVLTVCCEIAPREGMSDQESFKERMKNELNVWTMQLSLMKREPHDGNKTEFFVSYPEGKIEIVGIPMHVMIFAEKVGLKETGQELCSGVKIKAMSLSPLTERVKTQPVLAQRWPRYVKELGNG